MATVRDLSGNAPFNGVDKAISEVPGISRSYPVTLSDTVDIPQGVTTALNCAAAGTVKVTYATGIVDTVYLNAGIWAQMEVIRVWNTGTSATGVVAGYAQ